MNIFSNYWRQFTLDWSKWSYACLGLLAITAIILIGLRAPSFDAYRAESLEFIASSEEQEMQRVRLKSKQHYLIELTGEGNLEFTLWLRTLAGEVIRSYKVEKNQVAEGFQVVFKPDFQNQLEDWVVFDSSQSEYGGETIKPRLEVKVYALSSKYYLHRDLIYYVQLGGCLFFFLSGLLLILNNIYLLLRKLENREIAACMHCMVPTVIFVGVFLSVCNMAKTEFLYPDPDDKTVFNLRKEFTDDSGFYITLFALNQPSNQLTSQFWYQYQKDHLDMEQLFAEWGRYAPRIMNVYSTTSRINLVYNLNAILGKVLNDNTKGYFLFVALIPLLVVAKYLVLYALFKSEKESGIIIAAVLADVLFAHELSFSMNFAWHFFTIGACILFFSEKTKTALVFLMIASLSHLFCFALGVVLVTSLVLYEAWKKYLAPAMQKEIYLYASLFILASGLLLFGLGVVLYHYFIVDVGQRFFEYEKFWRALFIYLTPAVLACYGFAIWLAPSKIWQNRRMGILLFSPLLLICAIGAYCLIFAYTGNLEFGNNSWRLGYYLHWLCFMLLSGVLLYKCRGVVLPAGKGIWLLVILISVFTAQYFNKVGVKWSHWEPIQNNSWEQAPLEAKTASGHVVFYLADTPGHVFNYYVQEGYRMAPLVFNTSKGKYKKEEAIRQILEEGVITEEYVITPSVRSPLRNREWIRRIVKEHKL
ncbi:MAG: hypothetical protein AAF571_02545 [Verrucomicrobiota bacterium]